MEHLHHSPELPRSPAAPNISRRRLLQLTAVGAATILGIERLFEPKHGHEQHESGHEWSNEKKAKLLREYRQHPIFVQREPAKHLEERPDRYRASFSADPGGTVMCMDGRIQIARNETGLRLAGDGIVLERSETSKDGVMRAAHAMEYFNRLRADGIHITGVANHRCGCGACAIVAEKLGITGDADDLGEDYARSLSEKLRVPYKGPSKIEKNLPIHPEVALMFDETGRMQDPRRSGLPVSLVIHALPQAEKGYSELELKTGMKIVLGSHGIGRGTHQFNESNFVPVLAVFDGKKPHARDRVLARVEPVIHEMNNELREDIFRVIAFKAPSV